MKQLITMLSISLFLISCDKDFNTIGANLVGEDHFEVNAIETSTVVTENFRLAGLHPVQTDNLPYNLLGNYNDPIYGTTNANVLSQVELSEYGKDFGEHPVITKVVFSMPYFSRKTEVSADGVGTYELDSVYNNDLIKLSLYKSDYFLNDFDATTNFEERQKYYSNDDALFASNSFGNPANLLYEADDFLISDSEVNIQYPDGSGGFTVVERLSPRLIDSTSFGSADFDWIIDPANQVAVSSQSEFKDFYRGIYFKAEAATNAVANGPLLGLDLSQAEIEVFHGEYLFEDDGTTPIDVDGVPGQDIGDEGSIKILFRGNRVNTFTNNISYTEDIDKIYLKGGEGAMVKIDLFDPVSDDDRTSVELTDIQNDAENWLINEANLEFYVADDIAANANDTEPERVFLYDIENNKVLADYLLDQISPTVALSSIVNHLGRLERDDSGNGVKYKINITEHIKSIVKNDSTNVKLGLVVTNNVNLLGSSDIQGISDPESVLTGSITAHQGTMLYNENAVEPKRLKLKIHYSEIN